MKRSEINVLIADAKAYFDKMNFKLPEWAFRDPASWKGVYPQAGEIVDNMLGWDITDFASGNYKKRGLFLFTLRNGRLGVDRKTYAEKIMIVDVDQETPMHFHRHKMEDIINRGGGELAIQLYASDSSEGFSSNDIPVSIDGIVRKISSGGTVVLKNGESICLVPGVYHRFYAQEKRCLVGEVSMVNDDAIDNRFYEPIGRFPVIEEDEAPLHLLVSDYAKYL